VEGVRGKRCHLVIASKHSVSLRKKVREDKWRYHCIHRRETLGEKVERGVEKKETELLSFPKTELKP